MSFFQIHDTVKHVYSTKGKLSKSQKGYVKYCDCLQKLDKLFKAPYDPQTAETMKEFMREDKYEPKKVSVSNYAVWLIFCAVCAVYKCTCCQYTTESLFTVPTRSQRFILCRI